MTTPIRYRSGSHTALLLLVAGFFCPARADAAESPITATATLVSDYVFRGISQSMQSPALQGEITLSGPLGVYGYLFGSTIDFEPQGEPEDGAELELDFALGITGIVSPGWSADLAYVRYNYPGTRQGIDYGYGEWVATVEYRETLSAILGYSDNVFGSGSDGYYYALGGRADLPGAIELGVGVGHYDLSRAFGNSYQYVETSVSRAFGRVSVSGTYFQTFGDDKEIFYEQMTGRRVAVGLSLSF